MLLFVILNHLSKESNPSFFIAASTFRHNPIQQLASSSVKPKSFTRSLLEKNGEFTVNIPLDDSAKKILGYCGAKSGRDVDKAKEIGLTYEEPETISVPGVKELPLTLECKVVYKQTQDTEAMTEENREKFYPQNVESSFSGANRDTHIAYYGEIVDAYLIE